MPCVFVVIPLLCYRDARLPGVLPYYVPCRLWCCLVTGGASYLKSLTAGQQLINPPLFRGPVITFDGRKRGEKNKRLPGAEGPPEGMSSGLTASGAAFHTDVMSEKI